MLEEKLKEIALKEGIALFGIAEIKPEILSQEVVSQVSSECHSEPRFSQAKNLVLKNDRAYYDTASQGNFTNMHYAISIGWRLSKSVLETITDGPNQMYYFHYQRVNILLDMISLKLTSIIQENGYNAFPIPASQIVDWSVPGGKGLVSHKTIAKLSGLGWHGKNNLLVNPQYGSQIRFATILTDMPLKSNGVELPYGCGSCRNCIEICPAGAIGETPDEFQIDLCTAKLKEFQMQRKLAQMVCGLCVKICPGKRNGNI